MGVAFDHGLRAGRVLSCAKHFPGHGDTLVDPHHDLPVFSGTMERLESAELVPFAAAVAAGVPMVMTAHILLPKIDAERPASLSRTMLDSVLRRRMGFRGIILADDLGMGAIAKRYGPGEAAIETLRAGTDIAMLCHDWQAVAPAIETVRQSHEAGRFDAAEWQASLERIDRACALAELPVPEASLDILACEEFRALAAAIRARLA
jgi:beta-N-acetylhexosaminidase